MRRVSSLSSTQKIKLKSLYNNHESPQVRKRAHGVLLSHQGYSIEKIADIYNAHPDIVACWIDEWEKDGSLGFFGMVHNPIQQSLIARTSFRELVTVFRELEIPTNSPVIVHTSPGILGNTRREKNIFWGALNAVYGPIMAPAFTYQTMTVPKQGPANNGVDYEDPPINNEEALFYAPTLQPSYPMGKLPEIIMAQPNYKRSIHPILSFVGVRVDDALGSQQLSDPLAPIEVLTKKDGWVLLVGIDHTANVSIHHAEQLAGRKQFIRWARTSDGAIRQYPNFPGCTQGFNDLKPYIRPYIKEKELRSTVVTAVSLQYLIRVVQEMIHDDPAALLCKDGGCKRCAAVRRSV